MSIFAAEFSGLGNEERHRAGESQGCVVNQPQKAAIFPRPPV